MLILFLAALGPATFGTGEAVLSRGFGKDGSGAVKTSPLSPPRADGSGALLFLLKAPVARLKVALKRDGLDGRLRFSSKLVLGGKRREPPVGVRSLTSCKMSKNPLCCQRIGEGLSREFSPSYKFWQDVLLLLTINALPLPAGPGCLAD